MQIVIDIDENVYTRLFDNSKTDALDILKVCAVVRKGTPLPKGHGDLIDVNRKITVPIYDPQYDEWGEKTFTVREALNRWSDEGVTVKDVVILADKESEDKE